jgi:hypothetical protein
MGNLRLEISRAFFIMKKCLEIGCKGELIENHAGGSAHWLECNVCGETYSFYGLHKKMNKTLVIFDQIRKKF